MTDDEFTQPLGRRTIRRGGPQAIGNPLTPSLARPNPQIRMWHLGETRSGTQSKLRQAYLAALDAVDAIEARKVDAIKSGKFTSAGADADALSFALTNLVPAFKRGRNAIEAARREAKSLRDKIKLEPAPKDDLVGYMRRKEFRDLLRAMPDKQRNAYVSKHREDPEIAQAIVEMPAEFSGVLGTDREDLIQRTLAAQHGDVIAELKELEDAIEIAASAVEAGRDEVRAETGIADRREFDELAAPIEAKEEVPWLRRGRVVDLDRGIERQPTAEELANGIEAETLAEFNERKTA